MRAGYTNKGIRVTLSRRNLLTLLLKLDEPESKRTLWRRGSITEPHLTVVAESDEEHYQGREPGEISPRTQAALDQVCDQACPGCGAVQDCRDDCDLRRERMGGDGNGE